MYFVSFLNLYLLLRNNLIALIIKKIFFILIAGILFQSCFSYKKVENISNEYEVGKYYRVYQDKNRTVIPIKIKNDNTLLVQNSNFREQSLSLDSITKAGKSKIFNCENFTFTCDYYSLNCFNIRVDVLMQL